MNINFKFPFQQNWFEDSERIKVSQRDSFSDYYLCQVEAVNAVLTQESVYYFSDSKQAQKDFLYKAFVFADSINSPCKWMCKHKGLKFLDQKTIKIKTFTNFDLKKVDGYLIFDNLSDCYFDFQERLIYRIVASKTEKFRIIGASENFLGQLRKFDLISPRTSLLSST